MQKMHTFSQVNNFSDLKKNGKKFQCDRVARCDQFALISWPFGGCSHGRTIRPKERRRKRGEKWME